jgi:hypothetical protein
VFSLLLVPLLIASPIFGFPLKPLRVAFALLSVLFGQLLLPLLFVSPILGLPLNLLRLAFTLLSSVLTPFLSFVLGLPVGLLPFALVYLAPRQLLLLLLFEAAAFGQRCSPSIFLLAFSALLYFVLGSLVLVLLDPLALCLNLLFACNAGACLLVPSFLLQLVFERHATELVSTLLVSPMLVMLPLEGVLLAEVLFWVLPLELSPAARWRTVMILASRVFVAQIAIGFPI